MNDTLTILMSGACGIALKTAWSAWVDNKKAIELEIWKARINELEKRLSHFYWPIYIRLQRDNVVWTKILDRENQSNMDIQKLAHQIEQGVLLPNHTEIIKIIESNVHLAGLDKEFEVQLLAYLRHIDVYRSIRTVGIIDKDPIYFGEPYPTGFFDLIEKRLLKFQREYEDVLRVQRGD